MWPIGSGKFAIFTTGLTVSALVNDTIMAASAAYNGEYRPGYCINGQFIFDSRFKFYKVKRGDNYINNPDWLNWGEMVPFGAPFTDVNGDGNYNYLIDTPGVNNAAQTIFICLTDADSAMHRYTGFSGGTKPLGAEVHLTAWAYDHTTALKDIQFFKFEILNKSNKIWNGTYFTFFTDPDLGEATDDYMCCDTIRNLNICYNGDNVDGNGNPGTYGINPPAVGMMFLNNSSVHSKLNSYLETVESGSGGGPFCEWEPSEVYQAYRYSRGLKNDLTPYVVPLISPYPITKICYTGDPESGSGWNYPFGKIYNCGGELTGNLVINPPGDRRPLMTYGNDNFTVNPNERQTILYAQLIARGSNNLNSVTLLKRLADTAIRVAQNFTVGINSVSNEIPSSFVLYQNYPNPFNPGTIINYELGIRNFVSLKVYDALGKEVAVLVNEVKQVGRYEVEWNAADFPSGIYFYSLKMRSYSETKRMMLLK